MDGYPEPEADRARLATTDHVNVTPNQYA